MKLNSTQLFKIVIISIWGFITIINLIFCFINKNQEIQFLENEATISVILSIVGIGEHITNKNNK